MSELKCKYYDEDRNTCLLKEELLEKASNKPINYNLCVGFFNCETFEEKEGEDGNLRRL